MTHESNIINTHFTLKIFDKYILLSCKLKDDKLIKISLQFTDKPLIDVHYRNLLEKIIQKYTGKYEKDDFYLLDCPRKHKIVYNKLTHVKFGERVSYSDLSDEKEGIPPILVGRIMSQNPLPLIIPCHRVVGKKGDLRGFSCGIDMKKILLKLEEEGHEISYI